MVTSSSAVLFLVTAAAVAGMGWLFPSDGPVLLLSGASGAPVPISAVMPPGDVYLADAGLGIFTSLGDAGFSFQTPTLSPDGTTYALVIDGDIHLLDTASLILTRLTHSPEVIKQNLYWSPESDRIAYMGYEMVGDVDRNTFVVQLDGTITYDSTGSPHSNRSVFGWSLDGTSILIVWDERIPRFSVQPLDRSDPTDLGTGAHAAWSLGSGLIAIQTGNGVRIVDSGGKIIMGEEAARQPRWSNSGEEIAISTDDAIVILNILTRGRQLIKTPGWIWEMRWSPDDSQLAITVDGDIYIIGRDGGDPVNITGDPRDIAYVPVWSPNGQEIAFLRWGPTNELCRAVLATAEVNCRPTPLKGFYTLAWLP